MAVLSGSRLLSVNPQTCNYLAKLSCKNFPQQRILQGSAQCADYSQDWARKWSVVGPGAETGPGPGGEREGQGGMQCMMHNELILLASELLLLLSMN